MIPGTSKSWSKSGPGTLRIITKMLQKRQEKIWNHPGKILFLSIWDIIFFENFRNLYVLGTRFSFFLFFSNNICGYILEEIFFGDEDWKMINFPLIKSTKAWIWISFRSKNMNRKPPSTSYFQGRYPKFFLELIYVAMWLSGCTGGTATRSRGNRRPGGPWPISLPDC